MYSSMIQYLVLVGWLIGYDMTSLERRAGRQ